MDTAVEPFFGRIFSTVEEDDRSMILLVDQRSTACEALRMVLNDSGDMHVCAEAGNTFGVLEILQYCDPDLVLIGVSSMNSGALRLIRLLRMRRPRLKIVVLTTVPETIYGDRFFLAGACDCISKFDPMDVLLGRLRSILAPDAGLRRSSPVRHGLPALSNRELQIFTLCSQSLGRRAIALRAGLSARTVESHLESIRVKLNLEPGELEPFAARWGKMLSRAARAAEDESPVSDLAPENEPVPELVVPADG